jgi:hypothetical protein
MRQLRDDKISMGLSDAARQDRPVTTRSTLAGFETALRLIDDVNAALAAHDAIVAVTAAQRFQRITDFHSNIPPLRG